MSSNIAGVNSGATTSAGSATSSVGGLHFGGSNTNPSQAQIDVLSQSKDAQTMISVLKDMGIDDYEPKIVNQLLEFSYRT